MDVFLKSCIQKVKKTLAHSYNHYIYIYVFEKKDDVRLFWYFMCLVMLFINGLYLGHSARGLRPPPCIHQPPEFFASSKWTSTPQQFRINFSVGFSGTPNDGTPENGKRDPYYSLYHSHFGIPKDMRMVWEAYHKGVPLLGVPEISLEFWNVSSKNPSWTSSCGMFGLWKKSYEVCFLNLSI